ncbi:TetR/AcrR family transcriptional regulator [Actinospica robiniae]|uniref:TetR/AcrR family transcriptional regulator n=1 Tax=Actinospica robiniae TaxID=304901 RepID=UPI00054DDE31|nr:TetR/AcrR family transcriptional regulator [Actinospica robiniae]
MVLETPRRRRTRPGEGGLLREEILVAAESLLAGAQDASVLTLRAVAARTGVTTPAVYRHFADKDELVAAVCMRVWEQLGRDMRTAIDATEDPFQGLRRGAGAFVRFGLEHPVQYRLLMMGRPRDTGARPGQEAAKACLRHLAEATRPCIEAGVLQGDPERIALRALTCLHGCVALMIAHPSFPWPEDQDAFCDEVARMSGLGNAALGEMNAAALPGVPTTGQFVRAFDVWSSRLN